MNPFLFKWLKYSLVTLVVCGFMAMAVYAFLKREDIRTAQIEPPLITPPEQALKTRPEEPGGLEFPNQDKLVFDLLETTGPTPEPVVANITATVAASSLVTSTEAVAVVAEAVAAAAPTNEPVNEPAPAPQPAATPAPQPAATQPAQPAAQPAPQPAGGPWGVQLAAVSTEADARAAATGFQQRFSALSGLSIRVVPVPEGNRYRVQFTGLPNRAAAQRVCNSLGTQPCFPVGK